MTSVTNEINLFQSVRWISPRDAAWRIYAFHLNDIHPSVVSLQLHLPNMQLPYFMHHKSLMNILSDKSRTKQC